MGLEGRVVLGALAAAGMVGEVLRARDGEGVADEGEDLGVGGHGDTSVAERGGRVVKICGSRANPSLPVGARITIRFPGR